MTGSGTSGDGADSRGGYSSGSELEYAATVDRSNFNPFLSVRFSTKTSSVGRLELRGTVGDVPPETEKKEDCVEGVGDWKRVWNRRAGEAPGIDLI